MPYKKSTKIGSTKKKMTRTDYKPSDVELEKIEEFYKKFQFMREKVMDKEYTEFNNRTLSQFLDDSQKRANSYVASRDDQGKEAWQANIFTQYTRNKIKAQIASVARTIPAIKINARNDMNEIDVRRSDVMEKLVESSYNDGEMVPQEVIFFDGWDGAVNGTVIKYDGYLRTKAKVKTIKSYDQVTGDIEIDEQEKEIEDKPIELAVNLEHLFIYDPYIVDIQKQPCLIWTQYLNKEQFDFEFSRYKNHKYVEAGESMSQGELDLFFGEHWNERVEKDKIEIVRYYNKQNDEYLIIANGVLLLEAPLLWGKTRKMYPFAKTIYEPFSKSSFFWGNSLPNILMGNQDVANSFINSMVDKTYRTLATPMLIGMVNRDAFDLEDEYVGLDTKIYVDDVSQVTPMPVQAVNPSEFNMLNVITRGIDEASTDSLQSGFGGSGSTAREIVLANQRAEELKGLFFIFLNSLWIQKVNLRVVNILMNYNRPAKVEAILGEDGKEVFYSQFKNFNVSNAELSSGETGTLQIGVVDSQNELNELTKKRGIKKDGQEFNELDVREEESRLNGKPMEIIMITSDYLDNWQYHVEIQTETFYQSKKALDKALAIEKITTVAQLFPDIFMPNKKEFFKDLMMKYDDNPDKYLRNLGEQNPLMALAQGQEQALGDGQNVPVTEQMNRPEQSVARLSGAETI